MRELRAVRVSDDGKEILLTDATAASAADVPDPGFALKADDRLRAMLRPRPTTPETRPESALTPREIQARLRAGETAEEVARAAGIPVARVARYEAPIAAERVRIVDEVRRATAPGPHRVSPGRRLGDVVDGRLGEDGFDPALAQWLARRRPDGTWLVTVDLADHHAEWSWDGAARRVRAHDGGAQRLLSPSRSSTESLIAVAQATGVTTEPAGAGEPAPQPTAPLAPARAVGDSLAPTTAPGPAKPSSARSGLVVLPGEGTSPAAPRAQASPPAPVLDDVPGVTRPPVEQAAAGPRPAAWTPAADDVPGAGPGEQRDPAGFEPSASTSDAPEPSQPELGVDAASNSAAEEQARSGRPAAKSKSRRSAVPAWDDIVFGARRS